ncbi:MAG: AI-2E family transporter [Gemmatimonadaceae bacterium]
MASETVREQIEERAAEDRRAEERRVEQQRAERRHVDRRAAHRVVDLTLPELRRIMITSMLSVIVLALFLWMVRTVIIAAILGIVIGVYLRPLFFQFFAAFGRRAPAGILTLLLAVVPVFGVLAYSYVEVADVAEYVDKNQVEIAREIDASLHRLPFFRDANTAEAVRRAVNQASAYGLQIPVAIREAVAGFTVAAAIFLFTAFYVMIDGERIAAYIRGKIPPRYAELSAALERNVQGVLYGAIYSTLLTQTLKTVIILTMLVAFRVPLAPVLAILSFVIGFFPIVGSWAVYVPVAGWLMVFRDAPGAAMTVLSIGFFVNTLFISNYLRPKLAAQKSRVLNFYWMFVGLVTGVYTFGIAGILLGPILIGLLKAVVDTVTTSGWRVVDPDGDEEPADPSAVMP